MSEDAATARFDDLRANSERLLDLLSTDLSTDARMTALRELAANGEELLRDYGTRISPLTASDVHLTTAGAWVELAATEAEPSRSLILERVLGLCDGAAKVGLESGATFLPAEALPWAFGLLTLAMSFCSDSQRPQLQTWIEDHNNALQRILAQLEDEQSQAVADLATAGLLLDECATDARTETRQMIIAGAQEHASSALRLAASSGAVGVMRQARALSQRLEADSQAAAIATPAVTPTVAATPAIPAPPAPSRFCGECGAAREDTNLFCTRCGARFPD